MSSVNRMQVELAVAQAVFPSAALYTLEGRPLIAADLTTNNGTCYRVAVCFPADYPASPFRLVVFDPSPLRSVHGQPLTDSSRAMHTLTSEDNTTTICFSRADRWTPDMTAALGLSKARLWLEAFERHRETGHPIDALLGHQ